jgi:outer membrane protein assembly factor BamB
VTYGPRPRLVDLDGGDGRVVWFFPVTVTDSTEVGVHSGALVDSAGDIYFGAHDDYLYAITASGEMRWIFSAHGDVDGPPILTPDGTLIFGADDGLLYALRTP